MKNLQPQGLWSHFYLLDIQPGQAVSRGEAASMFYALLDAALLLEN